MRSVSFSPLVNIIKPYNFFVIWYGKKPVITIVLTVATVTGQATARSQCWAWPVTMMKTHEIPLIMWSLKGLKLFCGLENILEIKTSDGFHVIMLFLNKMEFRYWAEFLIDGYILEGRFSFDWNLCCDYRKPIASDRPALNLLAVRKASRTCPLLC